MLEKKKINNNKYKRRSSPLCIQYCETIGNPIKNTVYSTAQ